MLRPVFFLVSAVLVGSLAFLACSSSDDASSVTPTPDASVAEDAGDPVDRGKYLVNAVLGCPECHTPRIAGLLDPDRFLAGAECFVGAPLPDGGTDGGNADGGALVGCLNTRNLTNDATGLKNRTNDEIKGMFMDCVRPDGTFLQGTMPCWAFHNLTANDGDAIVAYLRTVPAIEHKVPPNEAPFDKVTAPIPFVDPAALPKPRAEYANQDAAKRGEYIATVVCVTCHTPEKVVGQAEIDVSRAFQGNQEFGAVANHFPMPPFPPIIYSYNLTPDNDTGLGTWSVDQIVTVLHKGKDKDGKGVCPPMPAGPRATFGKMTDEDATDVANFFLSIPPAVSKQVAECSQ